MGAQLFTLISQFWLGWARHLVFLMEQLEVCGGWWRCEDAGLVALKMQLAYLVGRHPWGMPI